MIHIQDELKLSNFIKTIKWALNSKSLGIHAEIIVLIQKILILKLNTYKNNSIFCLSSMKKKLLFFLKKKKYTISNFNKKK